jgi:hypothetical protein
MDMNMLDPDTDGAKSCVQAPEDFARLPDVAGKT